MNERVNERNQTFVACMEHDDDDFSDNLPPRVCMNGRTELPLTVRDTDPGGARMLITRVSSSTLDRPAAGGVTGAGLDGAAVHSVI